jgi:hypothetical protein
MIAMATLLLIATSAHAQSSGPGGNGFGGGLTGGPRIPGWPSTYRVKLPPCKPWSNGFCTNARTVLTRAQIMRILARQREKTGQLTGPGYRN